MKTLDELFGENEASILREQIQKADMSEQTWIRRAIRLKSNFDRIARENTTSYNEVMKLIGLSELSKKQELYQSLAETHTYEEFMALPDETPIFVYEPTFGGNSITEWKKGELRDILSGGHSFSADYPSDSKVWFLSKRDALLHDKSLLEHDINELKNELSKINEELYFDRFETEFSAKPKSIDQGA